MSDLSDKRAPVSMVDKATDVTESYNKLEGRYSLDIALEYVELTKTMEITEEENKRILKKIDFIVLPILCLTHSVQFVDRFTLSYSSIMGIRKDLHMVGDQYSWAASSFYFGYLCFAFIGAWTLQKAPLSKAVGVYLFAWGVVLALHAASETFADIIVCRVFLGMFESPLLGGLALIINNFYKKSEQYPRMAFIFSATGIGNIVGSAVAYGVFENKDSFAIGPWRFLFLILGICSCVFAVIFIAIVPDVPTKAWWLTEREKLLTVERIRSNEQGFGCRKVKWYQVKEAFLEPRVYLFVLLAFAVEVPNSGISAYTAILMKEAFGFSTGKALLMKAPLGVTQLVGLSALAFLNMSNLIKHPLVISTIAFSVATVGGLLFTFASSKYTQLGGFYLIGFYPVSMITALSGLSANIAGRTKKVVCNGIYIAGYAVAAIVGPQTFIAAEAPTYVTAKRCRVGFYSLGLIVIITLAVYNWWENRKRDLERDSLGEKYVKVESSEFADLTDRENRDFRYVW